MLSRSWIDGLSDIAIVWGSDLAVASIKVTVVVAIAALFLRSARRTSASFRHLVWFVAMTSPVALALLPYVLPHWRTPIPAGAMAGWFSDRVVSSLVDSRTDRETTARGLRSGGLLERTRPAAGARSHDHGLSGTELPGDRLTERRRTVCRPDDVNQFCVPQRFVDVMAGTDDGCESRQIAAGMNTLLLGDRRDVVGK